MPSPCWLLGKYKKTWSLFEFSLAMESHSRGSGSQPCWVLAMTCSVRAGSGCRQGASPAPGYFQHWLWTGWFHSLANQPGGCITGEEGRSTELDCLALNLDLSYSVSIQDLCKSRNRAQGGIPTMAHPDWWCLGSAGTKVRSLVQHSRLRIQEFPSWHSG